MSTTNNYSRLFAPAIMCLLFVFISTAFTQPYASMIMTKEEEELNKKFINRLKELEPYIVAEGILGNNGEIIFLNRKKYVNEYLGFDNIIIIDNKDKTFSSYYKKWPLVHSYGKINKNGRIDYSHVDALDFTNSKKFSGPKKWPKRCGEPIKISGLVGEKDWIMINSKPYIIFHIPKNTMGFMYELYNGKLFYPGGNAKMIKTSSLCYIVQTNEKKIEIKRCIDNTNVCIIENTDDFRPSRITWIDAEKGPWFNGVWPYMEKQNLPVMPDKMLLLSPDNSIIERKYKYINEHGDKIEILQPISRE